MRILKSILISLASVALGIFVTPIVFELFDNNHTDGYLGSVLSITYVLLTFAVGLVSIFGLIFGLSLLSDDSEDEFGIDYKLQDTKKKIEDFIKTAKGKDKEKAERLLTKIDEMIQFNKNYDEVAGELSNLEYDDDGNIVNIATMVSVITILNSN